MQGVNSNVLHFGLIAKNTGLRTGKKEPRVSEKLMVEVWLDDPTYNLLSVLVSQNFSASQIAFWIILTNRIFFRSRIKTGNNIRSQCPAKSGTSSVSGGFVQRLPVTAKSPLIFFPI